MGSKKACVTPTEPNVHGDALGFAVKTWTRHKTTEALLKNGWRLVAVGGSWSLGAVLNKKKKEVLRTALPTRLLKILREAPRLCGTQGDTGASSPSLTPCWR